MRRPTVLICGAGIAGPTLAYWLARGGFRPTVVERAGRPRSSGNPVDVRGPAVEVARRMGILPRLHDAATLPGGLTFVTGSGRRIGPLRLGRPTGDGVEVPRADLAVILTDAARDGTELLFGDSITALRQDDDGVDVEFEHAAPRRFDLVVGADGLHSTVRSLVFGAETDFIRHLGLSVATLQLGRPAVDPTTVTMYHRPGRSLTIHPARGDAVAAFIFRSQEAGARIVLDTYADDWPVPELPNLRDQLLAADDLYFDSVSRIRLPGWSRGRVTLLGDAACCLTLFGDGSSLAMTGAATLAETLTATPDDPAAAFRRYESRHRRLAGSRQRGHTLAAALLVPATRTGLTVRDLTARLLPRTGRPASIAEPAGKP